MTTTVITRDLLKALRTEMDAALKAVAERHGLLITTGNASFGPTAATFKLAVAVKGAGVSESSEDARTVKAASDWKMQAGLYGLNPEWLGERFSVNGNFYRVIGLMPRRPKFPVLAEKIQVGGASSGKNTLFPIETIQRAFATARRKIAA